MLHVRFVMNIRVRRCVNIAKNQQHIKQSHGYMLLAEKFLARWNGQIPPDHLLILYIIENTIYMYLKNKQLRNDKNHLDSIPIHGVYRYVDLLGT